MAPVMISVGEPVIAMALCEKQIAMACFRFVPTMLASLQKERERTLVEKPTLSGYLELGMFDDAALALE
jgi:hypothetical protein